MNSLTSINRAIKSRRLRRANYVARKCEKRGFWWGNLKQWKYVEDPGIDGRGAIYRSAGKSLARSGTKKSYNDRRFWCSYILFISI